MVTFQEIWTVFSTGKGAIHGLDTISLSAVFRIAEMELRGDPRAQSMREEFFEHEPHVLGHPIDPVQLDELIQAIKRNTRFDGTVVYNTDGRRRYENLPDVGFIITEAGFQTVILSDFN